MGGIPMMSSSPIRVRAVRNWALILSLYVFPVILLQLRILARERRFAVLFFVCALALLVARIEGIHSDRLGTRFRKWRRGLGWYATMTFIGVLGIVVLGAALGRKPILDEAFRTHAAIWMIPASIAQEFLFRGLLMVKLSEMFREPRTVVVVNATLFSFLHIMFGDLAIVLPLTFAGGLLFSSVYYKYPNLILASSAHVILNGVAVLYGFFPN